MSAPPVPAEVDLAEFRYFPLIIDRLFGSAFHARASDTEWRAGVTLWLKAYRQHPAGSLPDDDIELCRLAELGRDLKTWRKIKPMALHGWFLADDGRLYHKTVAEVVTEAWERKIAHRNRTEPARAARLLQRQQQSEKGSVGETKGRGRGSEEQNQVGSVLPRDINIPRSARGRAHKGFLKNRENGAAAPPPPINPKFLNHGDVCQCNNCRRWAEQHRDDERRSG